MNKKILFSALAVLTIGAGATFAANTTMSNDPQSENHMPMMGMMMHRGGDMNGKNTQKDGMKGPGMMMSADIKTAFENNDYVAFVKAFNTQLTNQTVPTAEEFTTMSTEAKQHEARKTAMEKNDYAAFVKTFASDAKNIPTQEEFNTMITMKKNEETLKAAILAGNYEAFKTTLANSKPAVPTQTEFTKMVEMHKTMKASKDEIKSEQKNLKKTNKNLKKTMKSTTTQQ